MPYLQNFTTLTMNGSLANDQDIWSCGIHLDNTALPEKTYAEWSIYYNGIIDDIVTACEGFIADSRMQVPAGVSLTSVKLAYIDTTGHYVDAPIEQGATATGNYNSSYIPQAAVVSTLVSSRFKDPGKYNRFYLPVRTNDLGADYQLGTTQQNNYAECVSEFITELNTILAGGTSPSHDAVSVVSSAGDGWSSLVFNVRVGRVVDTQRRRRNKLPESYVTKPVL